MGSGGITRGCEFGRVTRVMAAEAKVDVNNMGKKLDKIYTLLITTLFTILGSVFVGVIMFLMSQKVKTP